MEETKQSKLHMLLAVGTQLEGRAKNIITETISTFRNKAKEVFFGETQKTRYFDADAPENQTDNQQLINKPVSDNVMSKLAYTFQHLIQYYDHLFQKEVANQKANADLVVKGKTIAVNVPATMLLGLETRLTQVREILASVPTLPLDVKWVPDTTAGKDVWICEFPEKRLKSKKTMVPVVMYPATKEHPAQVKSEEDVKNIGIIEVTTRSGCVTTSKKSDMLQRCDELLEAVKVARQKANEAPAGNEQIGAKIFDYITG